MDKILDTEEKNLMSRLILDHLVCDELSFERYGFQSDGSKKADINVAFGVKRDAVDSYRVTMKVTATREDEFTATVQITGYFTVPDDDPMRSVLLNQNALAIIFPFVRSQMSLLTTQPETTPILLPVINIAELIKTSEELS